MKTTMFSDVPFTRWFVDHWMRVGIVMAVILLLITPVLILEMPWTIVLVYLQLPIWVVTTCCVKSLVFDQTNPCITDLILPDRFENLNCIRVSERSKITT